MKTFCAPLVRSAGYILAIIAVSFTCGRAAGSAPGGGENANTVTIPCGDLYRPFVGTWNGRFWEYVRSESTNSKSVYRPYEDTIVYTQAGCMRDTQTGETYIVGKETDRYPAFGKLLAKTSQRVLITGRRADGAPFLRMVDAEGTQEYSLVYRNDAAELAIWEVRIPASAQRPEMTFTTIDGEAFTVPGGKTRDVTVTLTVGPPSSPYWQGVIAYGSHTKA